MSIPLIRLHKFIVDHNDLEQLRALCFDLDVEYDDLGNKKLDHQVHKAIIADVTQEPDTERIVRETVAAFGGINVLVNAVNPGVTVT